MSIFPPSDLVINVGQAADPSRRALAIQRLERLSASLPIDEIIPPFPSKTHSFSSIQSTFSSSGLSSPQPQNHSLDRHSEGIPAYRKFEAFLLQTWLEQLLPKIDGGASGDNNASGVWRSLMAEQLGEQLARSDCIGISRLLDQHKTHAIDT